MDAASATPAPANPAPAVPSPAGNGKLTPETVVRDYGPRVYHLARRMLGNDADAEDVAQDVLMQVVRKLHTFRGEADPGTWLHRITVNAALAHRQKRALRAQRERHDPLDFFQENGHHAQPVKPWSVNPAAVVEQQETSRLIESAIKTLPDVYRDVYVLADVEGLPNAEIGGMLGLSVPAVKSRLHRARLEMRHALAKHFEEARGMTCRELAELLFEYMEGVLAAEQAASFRQHMDACPECVHFVESYQITVQITRRLQTEPLPNDVAERLRHALEQPTP